MSRRLLVHLLVGSLVAVVIVIAAGRVGTQALVAAADDVTIQLAGDLQAAFDPATLRPARNPMGAEYLVLRRGELIASSVLPLTVRPEDLMGGDLEDADPQRRPSIDGYVGVIRDAADDDGVVHTVAAFVPTAAASAGWPVWVLGLASLVVVMTLLGAVAPPPRPTSPSS